MALTHRFTCISIYIGRFTPCIYTKVFTQQTFTLGVLHNIAFLIYTQPFTQGLTHYLQWKVLTFYTRVYRRNLVEIHSNATRVKNILHNLCCISFCPYRMVKICGSSKMTKGKVVKIVKVHFHNFSFCCCRSSVSTSVSQ